MAPSGGQPAHTPVSWTFEPTRGLEPLTARLQVECATNCATPAGHGNKSRDKHRDNARDNPAARDGQLYITRRVSDPEQVASSAAIQPCRPPSGRRPGQPPVVALSPG